MVDRVREKGSDDYSRTKNQESRIKILAQKSWLDVAHWVRASRPIRSLLFFLSRFLVAQRLIWIRTYKRSLAYCKVEWVGSWYIFAKATIIRSTTTLSESPTPPAPNYHPRTRTLCCVPVSDLTQLGYLLTANALQSLAKLLRSP